MSGAFSWPSAASSPPNLRNVETIVNVRRIGTLTDRDTDLLFGEHFGIFESKFRRVLKKIGNILAKIGEKTGHLENFCIGYELPSKMSHES